MPAESRRAQQTGRFPRIERLGAMSADYLPKIAQRLAVVSDWPTWMGKRPTRRLTPYQGRSPVVLLRDDYGPGSWASAPVCCRDWRFSRPTFLPRRRNLWVTDTLQWAQEARFAQLSNPMWDSV